MTLTLAPFPETLTLRDSYSLLRDSYSLLKAPYKRLKEALSIKRVSGNAAIAS